MARKYDLNEIWDLAVQFINQENDVYKEGALNIGMFLGWMAKLDGMEKSTIGEKKSGEFIQQEQLKEFLKDKEKDGDEITLSSVLEDI